MRCFFGLHKWANWKTDEGSELIRVYANGMKGVIGFFQDRTCTHCGIAERRKVKSK